ncbi:MAG: D-alanyl-D-alanine carboxypeptidase family protein [Solirubrobacterales bacterium]
MPQARARRLREPRSLNFRTRQTAFLALQLALVLAAPASAKPDKPPQPAAEAWVLIDAGDGERLAARRPTEQRSIASATKLMTAYLALKQKNLDKKVSAPAYEALAAESLLGLEAGERISYRELLYALILASANDGAVTVAEGVSGSIDRFIQRMNAAAARLGLDDTSYANPIGLDDSLNYSSAADLAELTTILLDDPFFRKVADTESHTVETDRASRPIVTRNDLLGRAPYVSGVKTGFTGEAGNVLVGSGERKGVRLVAVVLGAPSESARDDGVFALLEYGFSLYKAETPVRARQQFAAPPVDSGGTVELLARTPVTVSARKDQDVETEVDAPADLSGPIRKGERLGRVSVSVDDEAAGSSPLIAARAVAAPSVADEVRNNAPSLALIAGIVFAVLVIVLIFQRGRRSR